MTTITQDGTLIFKDRAGGYYLLPQAALERGRVPAERAAEVERLIAESKAVEGEDTQGHFLPLLFLAGCAAFGTGAAIGVGFSDVILDYDLV
jgi:hypothetical protein